MTELLKSKSKFPLIFLIGLLTIIIMVTGITCFSRKNEPQRVKELLEEMHAELSQREGLEEIEADLKKMIEGHQENPITLKQALDYTKELKALVRDYDKFKKDEKDFKEAQKILKDVDKGS